MLVLACADKFRGTLTAAAAATAISVAVRDFGGECVERPLADGGEGTLDALGGANRTTEVTGPLGSPVAANWRLDGGTAVLEAAQACGLELAGGARRNDPIGATSRGVGELIATAVRAGAQRILLGVGGSATTDGGTGALDALAGVSLDSIELVVCCDVRTPFTRAAAVFGPQKGADETQLAELAERLARMRADILARSGVDLDALPGSGAAGGLAGGLATLGARLVPGFDAIAEHLRLADDVAKADLVVTGEGRLDQPSLDGKVVGGVLDLARAAGREAVVVCGRADVDPGVPVLDLVELFGADRAAADAAECVTTAVRAYLAR